MLNLINQNKCKLVVKFILLVSVSLFPFLARAQPSQIQKSDQVSRVYVFFDESHSFVQKNNTLVSTNFITVDSDFASDVSTNVFGSEQFCKNIFYFSGNKIIFYNPSQDMSSSVWCQIQISDHKTKKTSNYRFVLNKTFSSWCQEKDTNLSIGKTVKSVLNIFESKVCSDSIVPVLAQTRMLNLSNSHLDDLSPIAGFLQVRSLWLDNNEIESVEPLEAMQNLVFLSLNNNFISNAKSLGELSGLRWVFLNNNQIMGVDFIHNLKSLKFLGINGNLVGDATPLYDVSPSTYILANGNPFLKDMCSKVPKNFQNSSKDKNAYLFKNCLNNASVKQLPDDDVPVLAVPVNSHGHKEQSSQAEDDISSRT